MTSGPSRWLHRHPIPVWARRAFVVYAIALFTATHWPQLRIEGPVPRPDLILHLVCFGGWSFLFIACGLFGAPFSWRNIALSLPCGIAYAAIDEGLQAIPIIQRTCAWDDFFADVLGILAGGVIASIILLVRGRAAPQPTR